MANIDSRKCVHPACRCAVAADQKYCSQRCEDAKGDVEISCDCAHMCCSFTEAKAA